MTTCLVILSSEVSGSLNSTEMTDIDAMIARAAAQASEPVPPS